MAGMHVDYESHGRGWAAQKRGVADYGMSDHSHGHSHGASTVIFMGKVIFMVKVTRVDVTAGRSDGVGPA